MSRYCLQAGLGFHSCSRVPTLLRYVYGLSFLSFNELRKLISAVCIHSFLHFLKRFIFKTYGKYLMDYMKIFAVPQ